MTRRDFAALPALAALPAAPALSAVPALPALPALPAPAAPPAAPIALGSRRELFVDRFLVAGLEGAELRLATPLDAGPALAFDRPWEGAFCAYSTVLRHGGRWLLYYRGVPSSGPDGRAAEVTCVAESADGRTFTRPELGLFAMAGAPRNNVVLANAAPFSHNFSPFVDTCPGVGAGPALKAIAGVHSSGLHGFVSADGFRWTPVQAGPVLPSPKEFTFDSQNVAFYSEHERKYVLYYRTWQEIGGTKYRWVSRAVSEDFVHWTTEGPVDYGGAPPEHLYTNQTSPYFRAPHIYAGICARFFPGRQVLTEAQARAVQVDPQYFQDCSDAVLVTSRGGRSFSRTFLDAFLRPGLGLQNWVSRSNYPALNLAQTGPAEMSFYVNRDYGQPTAHLRRYALRLDGFASLHAGYGGGTMLTHPVTFTGHRLALNYATSAAGSVRVELLDGDRQALPGFGLADAAELIGDEIEGYARWKQGVGVGAAQGRVVRLRFHLKDADVYSFGFLG
ncbi:glycoside hydrolase family protein [Paludibaculum fermentans]|uniref:hypothetical protein n=1 Tax=Paludibaculum fermentans TaxID=1473598 RepID=UPI001E610059|nr:hypothetical protein [Paludibaculum fermentans]